MDLHPKVAEELRDALRVRRAATQLTRAKIDAYTERFRNEFGPLALSRLGGENLLLRLHGRGNDDSLAYWLEFKNDDEFESGKLGSIAGGSALKFGLYLRKETETWMTGSSSKQIEMSLDDAIALARRQRDQLTRAAECIERAGSSWDAIDYARLDADIHRLAPDVADSGWAHKYLALLFPDRIDSFHTANYQAHNLIRSLIIPPQGGRYVAAGAFANLADRLDMHLVELAMALNERNGSPYQYWRVGTSLFEPADLWPLMRDTSTIALGWSGLGDLSEIPKTKPGKAQLAALMHTHHAYSTPQAEGRAVSQVFKFVTHMQEGDVVVAADGRTVLGAARIVGDYRHVPGHDAPHRRSVEWLDTKSWAAPSKEGLLKAVSELRGVETRIAIERRILEPESPTRDTSSRPTPPRLSGTPGHIEAVLERKSQVILFGPPGTGKTYWAEHTALELAARGWHDKTFDALSVAEREAMRDVHEGVVTRAVEICTFHPSFGYEDFIEGLRPANTDGQLTFIRRDGILKRVADAARRHPTHPFYLLIDEINRGDIPRIFGELLTILEKSKRGKEVRLAQSGDAFSVPRNLFVIGTMNTADRSIALLDTALRRRFGFIELMPDSVLLGTTTIEGLSIGAWLDALNDRIRENLGRDGRNLQIGHSYLMHGSTPIADVARFVHAIQDEIVPLLQEYAYEDYETLQNLLGKQLVDLANLRIRSELFDPQRRGELIQALVEPFPELTASQRTVESDETQPLDEEAEELE